MKYYSVSLRVFYLLLTFCFDVSLSQTSITAESLAAPSHDLPAEKILALLNIRSLHFITYDSVVVEGQADSSFNLVSELFFDKDRIMFISYGPKTVTVSDLKRKIMWNSLYGKLTYYKNMNLKAGYDQEIQASLGSWLKPPVKFLRSEKIREMECNVFTDASGTQEWVWKKYRLIVQRRRFQSADVFSIVTTQNRGIEVNRSFPDSLFEPPNVWKANTNSTATGGLKWPNIFIWRYWETNGIYSHEKMILINQDTVNTTLRFYLGKLSRWNSDQAVLDSSFGLVGGPWKIFASNYLIVDLPRYNLIDSSKVRFRFMVYKMA